MIAIDSTEPHWHQALAYALLGERLSQLGQQPRPDLTVLVAELPREEVLAQATSGEPWPHRVPADLMEGIGPAQFAAVLQQLRTELVPTTPAKPGRRSARPDAAEQRLLRDVPPHHGT